MEEEDGNKSRTPPGHTMHQNTVVLYY